MFHRRAKAVGRGEEAPEEELTRLLNTDTGREGEESANRSGTVNTCFGWVMVSPAGRRGLEDAQIWRKQEERSVLMSQVQERLNTRRFMYGF